MVAKIYNHFCTLACSSLSWPIWRHTKNRRVNLLPASEQLESTKPNVNLEQLQIGQQYERPQLAKMWGYRDWHATGRGVFTPTGENKIILFVTKDNQKSLTSYNNGFDEANELFYMDGEQKHQHDQKLAESATSGDERFLFYRHAHHAKFTFHGRVYLVNCELRQGSQHSKFVFALDPILANAARAISIETFTHGQMDGSPFKPDSEGARRTVQHISYERSSKNRAAAIKLHGTKCKVCGFDFNDFYGYDLAVDYIEIHHVKPITEVGGGLINPETDLVPLCSNCHSMVHKNRDRVMPIDDLREVINYRRLPR